MATPETGSGHPDIDATDARSGRPGVPVLWVLIISTVVALLAVAVIWGFFSHRLGGQGGSTQVTSPAQASKFDTPTVTASPVKPPA